VIKNPDSTKNMSTPPQPSIDWWKRKRDSGSDAAPVTVPPVKVAPLPPETVKSPTIVVLVEPAVAAPIVAFTVLAAPASTNFTVALFAA
jgi:hypothetical protein